MSLSFVFSVNQLWHPMNLHRRLLTDIFDDGEAVFIVECRSAFGMSDSLY